MQHSHCRNSCRVDSGAHFSDDGHKSNHFGGHTKIMQNQTYWQKNLRLIARCLVVWFVVSYGFGLLLVEPLNAIRVGGFKLGFWFAQQGAIYVFVALVFYYAWAMNKLDDEFDVKD